MISMISSVGKNLELGKNNNLIWRFSQDMKFFKNTTMGHKVIMGLNTYKSLPGKLPGREMIVISYDDVDDENIIVCKNLQDIISKYVSSEEEIFICGGASIYKQFIDYADKLYLTEIDASDKDADTFFPLFDKNNYVCSVLDNGEQDGIKFTMKLYVKNVNKD